MPRIRPLSDVLPVLALKASGRTDREVSRLTGVPINTIRTWRNRRLSRQAQRALKHSGLCSICGLEPHDHRTMTWEIYAYLLGVYLGDGCITRNGTSWMLRVTLDDTYPGIVESCAHAIEEIRGKRPTIRPHHGSQRCVTVSTTFRSWICLFPQHGPGRKHTRKIALAPWQQEIVDAVPEPFLRGLIHADGWRGLNRVHVKGKDYSYPRYQFSNRSDDIRCLFTDACDRIGVEWRRWTRYHISVARRDSVARLDSFIGPKH